MTRHCAGTWLRNRRRCWYRCALDGTVLRGMSPSVAACPRCLGAIVAPWPKVEQAARMVEQLLLPTEPGRGEWVAVAPELTVRADRREARA